MRRLLTLAHSYAVSLNRALANEMARAGEGEWEVTAVAPERFPGDFGMVAAAPVPRERCRLETVPVHLAGRAHTLLYGTRLREILARGWDVVHCWEEPFVASAAQVARWTPPGAALVFATFQNLPKRYPPPFRWGERYAMRRADGWIAFGHTVADALRERPGYRARPFRIIPPGVSPEAFRPGPEAGREVRAALGWSDAGPPVVGFLGRFVPQKGVHLLTRALDRVRTPWRALLVGGGPLEGELRSWAARYGDRVRIVTGVEHDRVAAHLNAMDLLCAPSQTTPRWKEQLGRMVLEAFACGVPVLASDSGELPHVVADAGRILPERDEEAWVAELERLLAAPDERREMAARGITRVRDEYAAPLAARRHLDFFASLAAGTGAGPL